MGITLQPLRPEAGRPSDDSRRTLCDGVSTVNVGIEDWPYDIDGICVRPTASAVIIARIFPDSYSCVVRFIPSQVARQPDKAARNVVPEYGQT